MKIFVLGGGVIGVTTAYYLAEAGHEVTVFDRQKGPALETSFANAGEVSPGYASPWAGPGIPLKAIKWLLMKHGPLVVRPAFDPHMWTWLLKMLRNCTAERYAINKSRMVPLAEYSRDTLKALREATGIAYDERTKGTLQLFRTQKQLDGTGGDVEVLKKYGVPYELLDREGCIGAEPALAGVRGKFVGGLRLPGDETGDCKMFTDRMAELCVARGVTFEYGTTISYIVRTRNRIKHINTEKGWTIGRRLCDGAGQLFGAIHAQAEAADPGLSGQGLFDHRADQGCGAAPVSTVMDETYKVAITRLGDRIRVGGTAEISGFDLRLHESRRRTLEHSVGDLFPDGGDLKAATLLVRPAADDAGRAAADRPHRIVQPLSQHRPRHARLDHGLRLGQGAGRHHLQTGCRTINARDLSPDRYLK